MGKYFQFWTRPVGVWLTAFVVFFIVTAPGWMFFDPTSRVSRDPSQVYRLHSDDYAYLAASRTLARTVDNLFVPHNTHVVPAWRVVCWVVSASAGSLANLPNVLALASYGILVGTMLLTGRFVARETGRTTTGLAAMAILGTTQLMRSPGCWFSAGQTLWAGFGVLATLYYLQGWRRYGGKAKLLFAAMSAIVAGWFWTVGHMAGPVGAIYLWADGRGSCRRASVVPMAATAFAVVVGLALGGRQMDARVSFHGRTVREAANPVRGVTHTLQAIPENLILGTLGLTAATTEWQGAVLSAGIALGWFWSRRMAQSLWPNPLEAAGATLTIGSYLVEWTARGYLPFSSLRGIVPWYDAVPEIGLVLFTAGWISGPSRVLPTGRPLPMTRLGAIGILALSVALVVSNYPRVEFLWSQEVPRLTDLERKRFPIPLLQRLRNNGVAYDFAEWHRRNLRKLDSAEIVARKQRIGRETIREVFGRVDAPELPLAYDAGDLLVLPEKGDETDPARVRRALGRLLQVEPMPRPLWLDPGDRWPPDPIIPK